MTTTDLHASVLQLAEESGLLVERGPEATVLEETEIAYTVARTAAGWTLTRRSRGRVVLEVVSDVVEGVEVVLLSQVGQAWRLTHGLGSLVTGERGTPVPGAVPFRDADGRWSVRWPGGHVLAGITSISIETIVRMVGRDVEELVASYRHPDGLPVFPPEGPAAG